MKRVIRKGIFETNSSSTHSLSLVRGNEKVNGNISFEIKSRIAKTTFILGLIDNAEENFQKRFEYLEDYKKIKEEKKRLIDYLKEYDSDYEEVKEKYGNLMSLDFTKVLDIIREICVPEEKNSIALEIEDPSIYVIVYDYLVNRDKALMFKEALIKTFCEEENVSEKEGMDKLYYEEYKNGFLEKILLYSDNKEEELKEFMEKGYGFDFKINYARSENKNLVEFANDYLKDSVARSIKEHEGKFYCTRYFKEGALDECECGFENFEKIIEKFKLEEINDCDAMREFCKKILSNEYKFEAIEKYCGRYFEGKGEAY